MIVAGWVFAATALGLAVWACVRRLQGRESRAIMRRLRREQDANAIYLPPISPVMRSRGGDSFPDRCSHPYLAPSPRPDTDDYCCQCCGALPESFVRDDDGKLLHES